MRLPDAVARQAEQAGGWLGQTIGKARDAACGLYAQYPNAWAPAFPGDPVTATQRGFMDEICRGKPQPQKPAQAFNGGQCLTTYRVVVQQTSIPEFGSVTRTFSHDIAGPMKFAGITNPTTAPSFTAYCMRDRFGFNIALGAAWADPSKPPLASSAIVSVTRVDGQPDTCGNPPPDWGNPAQPPPSAYTPPGGDVTYTDGTKRPVGIVITPVFVNNRIEVDVGGVKVNFDLGGVTVKLPDGVAPADDCPCEPDARIDSMRNVVDAIRDRVEFVPVMSDYVEQTRNIVDEIQEDTEQIQDAIDKFPKPIKPPDDPDYEPEEKTEQDPKEEEGIERFRWLKIELTTLPASNKIILKTDGQIVTYAGWVEFRAKGHGLPRMQIQYPLSIFSVPDGVDGYSYTLTHGARGRATVIKEKPQQPISGGAA